MGRKSKVTERRKEILDHFYMVIREEGFENASIAKIAKRMEVNPSLLIHYFSTKEEMIKGLVDSILDHYQRDFLPVLERISDPKARLAYLVESLSGSKYRENTEDSVYYSCYSLLFRDHEIKSQFREVYSRICNLIASELQRAKDAGVIQIQDTQVAASMMIWIAEGMSFYNNIFDQVHTCEQGAEMLQHYLAVSR